MISRIGEKEIMQYRADKVLMCTEGVGDDACVAPVANERTGVAVASYRPNKFPFLTGDETTLSRHLLSPMPLPLPVSPP